jgi:hypothetical protein
MLPPVPDDCEGWADAGRPIQKTRNEFKMPFYRLEAIGVDSVLERRFDARHGTDANLDVLTGVVHWQIGGSVEPV